MGPPCSHPTDVVGVAPHGGSLTTGEHTATVTRDQGSAERAVDEAGLAAEVEDFGVAAHDHSDDGTVTREPECGLEGDGTDPFELAAQLTRIRGRVPGEGAVVDGHGEPDRDATALRLGRRGTRPRGRPTHRRAAAPATAGDGTAGRVRRARQVEGPEEGLGALRVEVTADHSHPVERFVDVEVAAFVDLPGVELRQLVVGDGAPRTSQRREIVDLHARGGVDQDLFVALVFGFAVTHHRREHLEVRARELPGVERLARGLELAGQPGHAHQP